MTKEEILEGNKLIAEFLGCKVYKKRYPRNHGIGPGNLNSPNIKECILEKLKYHESWNDLMLVIEKIESIENPHHGFFGIHISSNGCSIQGTKLHLALEDLAGYGYVYCSDPNAIFETKIESTWYNIVEFIKWWNIWKK